MSTRYPRAISSFSSIDTTAMAPNTASVATTTRRYSSRPAPMTRGDRARLMASDSIQAVATAGDTRL
ncbi:hypothetical protein [Mycolicibacterium murale]|uniref:hypothetical protein n=1 Tax=Mycolicibacterium murale TaxID=182220 RepID=UPI0027E36D00|nr:hypothetical protein [Mycolicibacterium murale]